MKYIKHLMLILLLILVSSCGTAQTIKIDDYVTIETYGIDGHGIAVASFDSHLMDYLLDSTSLTLFEVNEMYESLTIEPVEGLFNDDLFIPKVSHTHEYPIKLVMDDKPIEVHNLPNSYTLDENNLEELLRMNFTGLSGGSKLIDARFDSLDPFILDLQLTPHTTEQISEGDTLIFDVTPNERFKRSGYQLTTDQLSIEVNQLETLVTDPMGLTSQEIEQLIQMGERTILDYLQSMSSIEIVNYSTGTNPLEQYSVDKIKTDDIEISELILSHVSLILYYSSDEITRLRPHNVSRLHLTFDTTFNTPDGIYEDIQIGVFKDSNFVSYQSSIVLGNEEDYYVETIQNRKGDIYRLAYDQSLNRYYTNVEYVDWSFE